MANEVGTITVRADTRQVDKGTKSLRNMGRQAGKTEKQVNKMEKAGSRLGRTFGRLAAGVSVGLFARKVIQNTKEQEQAVAQINQTLRSTKRYSDEASEAIQAQARAYQSLTSYGDEAVLRAQGVLLTFRRIGSENFPRATEATLDLATAMGTDLKSAALQIGKALEDPATQMTYLSRAGITFTQEQKEVVRALQKTGDLAGAQAVVLKELETQFGGSARAARQTFGGALSAVGNAFGDLLEGDTSGGGITGATTALNELEKTLQSPAMEAGFDSLIAAVALTVEWFAKGVTGITNFSSGLGEFFAELVHGPEFTTIKDVSTEIERVEKEIERAKGAWVDFSGGEYTANLESDLARLRLELELLQNKASKRPAVAIDPKDQTIPFATEKDPDSLLITIDNEALKARLDKATAQFKSKLRRLGETASAELSDALANTSAELAGPAAEANLRYAESLEQIDTWQRQLQVSNQLTAENQGELNRLRDNAAETNRRELVAIEDEIRAREEQLTPTERMIEALQLELDLMKLGADEREREIIQRQLAGEATEEQLAAIDQLIMKRQEAERSIETLDEIRGTTQGFLLDLTDGTGSVGDAFDNMFERIRRRALELATEHLVEKIFGAFGTAGSGTGGGGFAAFIGGLFAGGRARGGMLSPGRIHEVLEQGPELLTVGGRSYIMAGSQGGTVQPINQSTTDNSSRQTFNINLPPTLPQRTAQQVGIEVMRRNRRYTARNA